MSDLVIRVIPTDVEWQPSPAAASATAAYVESLFAGPGDHVEQVSWEFYPRITVIDCGEYLEDVVCPRCGTAIGPAWFWELLGESPVVASLEVTVPCCGATVGLPAIRFEAPVGFARFEVQALNWTRGAWILDDQEIAEAGRLLGHPVTQIHAHY